MPTWHNRSFTTCLYRAYLLLLSCFRPSLLFCDALLHGHYPCFSLYHIRHCSIQNKYNLLPYLHATHPPIFTAHSLEEQLAKASIAPSTKRGRSPSPGPDNTNRRHHKRGQYPQSKKELSPLRHAKRARRDTSGASDQVFPKGAGSSSTLSACTLCLGRQPHNIFKCASDTLWDGSKAHCKRNENMRLVNPAGTVLCTDWQRPGGCSSTSHDSKHECSGCGKLTHGAQTCPRAQKN